MSVNIENSTIEKILKKAAEKASIKSQRRLLYSLDGTYMQVSYLDESTDSTNQLFQVYIRSGGKLEFYRSSIMPRPGSKIDEMKISQRGKRIYEEEIQINQVASKLLSIFDYFKIFKPWINYIPNDGCDDTDCV